MGTNIKRIKLNIQEFEYESNKIIDKIEGLTKVQENIIQLLLDRSSLTQVELANILGVGEKIRYNMKDLIDKNYIKRVGSNKTGKWNVIIKESKKL